MRIAYKHLEDDPYKHEIIKIIWVLEKINSEKKKLVLLEGASHLFEEPGKIEEVAKIASGWFRCYFQIKAKSIQV